MKKKRNFDEDVRATIRLPLLENQVQNLSALKLHMSSVYTSHDAVDNDQDTTTQRTNQITPNDKPFEYLNVLKTLLRIVQYSRYLTTSLAEFGEIGTRLNRAIQTLLPGS